MMKNRSGNPALILMQKIKQVRNEQQKEIES